MLRTDMSSEDITDAKLFWPRRKNSSTSSQDVPHVHQQSPPAVGPVHGGSGPAADDEEYNMNHKYRGKAIIFNHYKFLRDKTPRVGTEVDERNLKSTFGSLGFKMEVNVNFRKFEVLMALEEEAERDHSDEDCLVVVVLTHGSPNELSAYDTSYPTKTLWEAFTADKCPTLAGKPKLFFIQACRGKNVDSGVRIFGRFATQTDGIPRVSYVVPTMADILIAFATFDGHYAWRNGNTGSWFIEALCRELTLTGQRDEILEILTRVNRRVAITNFSYTPGVPEMHEKKQMPNFLSTLIRKVYLRPKKDL